MSIGNAMHQPNRRRYENCDIWDLVAPQVACPACNGEVAARWERDAAEAATAEESTTEVVDQEAPIFQDLPGRHGDVRAEAELLLGLLAS